jgi:hypothetical protein
MILLFIRKTRFWLFLYILLLIQAQYIFAQNVDVEKYEFYFGTLAPLMKLESQEMSGKYYFYANNNSFYPLWIKVECNLTNMICSQSLPYEDFVFPGKTTLFYLEVKDKDQTYSYDFRYNSRIDNPNARFNEQIIYLIPLKPGKKTKIYQDIPNQKSFVFCVNQGDTIFASRKGFICGIPMIGGESGGRTKYSISNNLEIMHTDGSFGIYSNLDPEKIFVRSGQHVNAGDTIGIAKTDYMNLNIILFNSQLKIENKSIKFFTNEQVPGILMSDKEYLVVHPDKVIEQEMSKNQIKKRKKQLLKAKTD